MTTTDRAPLPADVRAVIDVVLDALHVPYAATAADDRLREDILRERTMATVVALRNIAKRDRGDHLADDLRRLRERLAERPATGYVTRDQARRRLKEGASWREAVEARP